LHAAVEAEELAEKEAGVVQGDGPGLRQRALPFIELLQRNHRAGHEVVWGV
jgi:hypothetical protein